MRVVACSFVVLSLLLPAGAGLSAGGEDPEDPVPLQSWVSAPFWVPSAPEVSREAGSRYQLTSASMASVASVPATPLPFYAISPCRLVDTRVGVSNPLDPGAWGPPALIPNTNTGPITGDRAFVATGTAQCASVPAGAQAVAANVAVINYASSGRITIYPADAAVRPTAATLNFRVPLTYSPTITQNYAIIALDGTGSFRAFTNGATDLVVDVNGYYAPANQFCMGSDCRTSWNGQDDASVSPMPRTCAVGQIAVATGAYAWRCANLCTAAGTADCGGTSCTNTTNNVNNCGACGTVCPAPTNGTAACVSSVCTVGSCNSGWGNCDSNAANGCEANLTSNVNNCGACGTVCPAPANGAAACLGSICTIGTCNAGFANCDGVLANGCEANLTNSVNNCGACAKVCPTPANGTAACVAAVCLIGTCNTGYADCDQVLANGCEVNLRTSNTNCGACGHACSGTTPNCVNGACSS
jgi:hypothetical protein